MKVGWRMCVPVLALSIAGGCATMSEPECINADWREVGRNDGLEGKPQTQLARHYDACAKYGITPNREQCNAGREAGLAIYCTQDSGYWEGRNGAGYQRVCPASAEPAFLAGYRTGKDVYDAIENVRYIRAQIASAKDRIGSLEDEIRKIESPDGNGDTDDSEDEKPAGSVEDRRKEIRKLDRQLDELRALRVLAVAEYVRAVERANSLGYSEEILLEEFLQAAQLPFASVAESGDAPYKQQPPRRRHSPAYPGRVRQTAENSRFTSEIAPIRPKPHRYVAESP